MNEQTLTLYVLESGEPQRSTWVENGGDVTIKTDNKPYLVIMRPRDEAPRSENEA